MSETLHPYQRLLEAKKHSAPRSGLCGDVRLREERALEELLQSRQEPAQEPLVAEARLREHVRRGREALRAEPGGPATRVGRKQGHIAAFRSAVLLYEKRRSTV